MLSKGIMFEVMIVDLDVVFFDVVMFVILKEILLIMCVNVILNMVLVFEIVF